MSLNNVCSPGDQFNRTLANISNVSTSYISNNTPINKIKNPIKGTPGQ